MTLITLSTLAKPTFLFFGLPLAAVVGRDILRDRKLSGWLPLFGAGVLVAGCNAFFIKHATNLYHLAPVERAAHTPIGPAEMPGSWAELWRNMEAAATTWFIEMNINLAALPLFLFGAYLLIKNKAEKNTQGRLFWMAWTLSFAIFSVLFIARFADHDYYITPTLPLAALVSSYGAARLWQYRRGRWALAILAPLILSIAVSRSYSRWLNSPQIPLTLREQAADIAALIPKDDLVLVQGDKTPIVFLYYLKRKGYSVDAEVRELQSSRLRDFRWLVRYDDYKTRHPDLDKLVHLKFVKKIRSDFSVYRIVTNSSDFEKSPQ